MSMSEVINGPKTKGPKTKDPEYYCCERCTMRIKMHAELAAFIDMEKKFKITMPIKAVLIEKRFDELMDSIGSSCPSWIIK